MPTSSRKLSMWVGLIALAAAFAPATVAAQSDLDAGQASEFMGTWAIAMESDYGPIDMDLEVTDMDGKVGVTVGSPDLGGMIDVADVTKDGAKLVLKYEADAQGQVFPVMIELEPSGEELMVTFDAADGQFFADGTATKK